MAKEKIGPDQVINLFWIASIVILIAVLYFTRPRMKLGAYVEVTGGSIAELAEKGKIELSDGVTLAWHGDTLCDPDELRRAAKLLVKMADQAEKPK